MSRLLIFYFLRISIHCFIADSAALTLNNLKVITMTNCFPRFLVSIFIPQSASASSYSSLLEYLFDPTDGANSAGLSYIRIPIGGTDLSASTYTYDDVAGDTSLSKFSISSAPAYVFSVLNDIKAINKVLKLHLVPWSPPAWMKDSNTIKGGNFLSQYESTCEYLRQLRNCE